MEGVLQARRVRPIQRRHLLVLLGLFPFPVPNPALPIWPKAPFAETVDWSTKIFAISGSSSSPKGPCGLSVLTPSVTSSWLRRVRMTVCYRPPLPWLRQCSASDVRGERLSRPGASHARAFPWHQQHSGSWRVESTDSESFTKRIHCFREICCISSNVFRESVPDLQPRSQWQRQRENLTIGSITTVFDPTNPKSWLLAAVTGVKRDLVRTVTYRMADGKEYERDVR